MQIHRASGYYLRRVGIARALACTIAAAGFAAAAHADGIDPGSVKDALPSMPTWPISGVTIYGTIDVGYAYQTNGVPINGAIPGGLEYQAFTTTRNFHGSVSTVAESGLTQSNVGIKIEEAIGGGWTAIGKLETGFNPLSGELADGCDSIFRSIVVPYNQQTANADSSRCGQAFNAPAYGGISNSTYGTLTIGRQQSLQLDALAQYDPQGLSYAFSFLGYSGFDAGAGSTEAARWDNSVKYIFQYGPVHVAGMYSNGGADTGILDDAYGFDVGGTYMGFSIDGIYERMNGVVNLRSAFDGVSTVISPTLRVPLAISAFISNDEEWDVMGKYTFQFEDCCFQDCCGGLKDQAPPLSKLTLYSGYSHIEKSYSGLTSNTSEGGYPIDIPIVIDRPIDYNVYWTGAKYELPSGWSFTAAYYYIDQNSFSVGVLPHPATDIVSCTVPGATSVVCAGDFNEASFVVDYTFNKYFDVYAGVNYSRVSNGLAAGFAGTPGAPTGSPYFANAGTSNSEDQTTFMTGMRVKF